MKWKGKNPILNKLHTSRTHESIVQSLLENNQFYLLRVNEIAICPQDIWLCIKKGKNTLLLL